MAYYLSEIYSQLDLAEQRRIQKKLGCILSSNIHSQRLHDTILKSLNSFSTLKTRFSDREPGFLLKRMLESFGIQHLDDLSEEEKDHLKDLPGIAFLDNNTAFIYAEALQLIAEEFSCPENQTLFLHLLKMGSREKQALKNWVLNDATTESGKRLASRLYIRMAELHAELLLPNSNVAIPAYLDQIWPNDPGQTRLGWFYRDVLPFYNCLQEEEQTILNSGDDRFNGLAWIQLFKTGDLICKAEKAIFGQETRYRILRSTEKKGNLLYSKRMVKPSLPDAGEKQGVLFK